MIKSELLNNVFFENAKGDFPIIYITSDDDVVKVGGIINAPMVGRIYFSEVKKTITKDELLANKEFICASDDSEISLISVVTDARRLIAISRLMIVALISLSYEE